MVFSKFTVVTADKASQLRHISCHSVNTPPSEQICLARRARWLARCLGALRRSAPLLACRRLTCIHPDADVDRHVPDPVTVLINEALAFQGAELAGPASVYLVLVRGSFAIVQTLTARSYLAPIGPMQTVDCVTSQRSEPSRYSCSRASTMTARQHKAGTSAKCIFVTATCSVRATARSGEVVAMAEVSWLTPSAARA